MQITAVDTELQELVYSWLICASVRSPNVSKAYQVQIPVTQDQFISKVFFYLSSFFLTFFCLYTLTTFTCDQHAHHVVMDAFLSANNLETKI